MSEATSDKKSNETPELPKEIISVTNQRSWIDGQEISYTVATGTMLISEENHEKKDGIQPKSLMFYVAYVRNDLDDTHERPVTFSFNGGPGSSSVWLHLGVLGPRRVQMADDNGAMPAPPFRLVDNEFSLLDTSDLVFIDPVSTGYSRTVQGEKPDQFHQFTRDIESVGEFIRLYVTRNKRWLSPKFLIGESYGTTRAAGVVGYLQQRHGMFFNGVMLISAILDFQTVETDINNDLAYILTLPTHTATAWYHGKLPPDLQRDLVETLKQAEQFAMTDYTLALMQGDALDRKTRAKIVKQLARFTGVSENFADLSNLRLDLMRYIKELLRDQRRTIGRLDSRFVGIDRDPTRESFDYDPSYASIQGPYTAVLNDYVRRELKYESDLAYEIFNFNVWPWRFDQHENRFVNVSEMLRSAMSQNPFLRVFVASGYYDFATPYFAARYTFNHLGLDPEQRKHVTFADYPAGHMMYIHLPSLAQLKQDLAAFVGFRG